MSKEHSPLPWGTVCGMTFDGEWEVLQFSKGEFGDFIGGAMNEANAKFIVTACNAYYANQQAIAELVDALEWAYNTLGEINVSNYSHDDVCDLNDRSVEVILGLKAPIAKHKAGGE